MVRQMKITNKLRRLISSENKRIYDHICNASDLYSMSVCNQPFRLLALFRLNEKFNICLMVGTDTHSFLTDYGIHLDGDDDKYTISWVEVKVQRHGKIVAYLHSDVFTSGDKFIMCRKKRLGEVWEIFTVHPIHQTEERTIWRE